MGASKPSSEIEVTPRRKRAARTLWWLGIAVHLLFVLFLVWCDIYVLPKRRPAFCGWTYSVEHDGLVGTILLGMPAVALALISIGDDLAKKKRKLGASIAMGLVLVIELFLAMAWTPVRSQSRERANRVKCASNLRQIHQAIESYAGKHRGQLPAQFSDLIRAEGEHPAVFVCPSGPNETAKGETIEAILEDFARSHHCSYAYRGTGLTRPMPAKYILAYEPLENHQGTVSTSFLAMVPWIGCANPRPSTYWRS